MNRETLHKADGYFLFLFFYCSNSDTFSLTGRGVNDLKFQQIPLSVLISPNDRRPSDFSVTVQKTQQVAENIRLTRLLCMCYTCLCVFPCLHLFVHHHRASAQYGCLCSSVIDLSIIRLVSKELLSCLTTVINTEAPLTGANSLTCGNWQSRLA